VLWYHFVMGLREVGEDQMVWQLQSREGFGGCRWTSEGWRVSEGVMPASERVVIISEWIFSTSKRVVRPWGGVAGVLGLDNETEREIHIHAGTTDCCRLRGYNPKSEKCTINSFSRAFRCNKNNVSIIYNGCFLKNAAENGLEPCGFFLIERASILVGNWSFRKWKLYLRNLLKILERMKQSHFTCVVTPSYWQTPKIREFAQLDGRLHKTRGEGCCRG